jgi:transglycosylase-like protein with SLT domain
MAEFGAQQGTNSPVARYHEVRTGTAGAAGSALLPPPEVLWRLAIPSKKQSVWTQLLLVVGAIAAIGLAVSLSRPFYISREPLGEQLIAHRYVDSASIRAPWLHASAEVSLQTPQFLLDRELFAMDLLRTGHVNQARARSLADVAVREAYTRKIPPALVLGVMLTENDELRSSARSHVGAVGLMQVYPKHWRDALGRKFGTNIRTDSTNLKYGIFILGWVASKATTLIEGQDNSWRKALLRYNGCVQGTNTHDCFNYPDIVRRQVQTAAISTCHGADFDQCVVQPMWLARHEVPPRDVPVAVTQEP